MLSAYDAWKLRPPSYLEGPDRREEDPAESHDEPCIDPVDLLRDEIDEARYEEETT
jgi:hypothetical protein